MRVIDLLNAPWAIRPDVLRTMHEVYERHARGEKFDLAAIEAATGKQLKNEPKALEVVDGVAVISITGILSKRMDIFTQISGGASTQRLQAELAAALDDSSVTSILLLIDSPGGEVDGTQALANDIFAARDRKPIVALIDGMGGSAAYWIASAASQVFISGDTDVVGSIGVVTTHTDVSKAQEMRGVKTTVITAGKFKAIANNTSPLSQEGRQTIQDIVDHIYSVFVTDVARNRGVGTDLVLSDMADGRLFLGEQAIKAGLVDGQSTMSGVIAQLNKDPKRFAVKGAHALNLNKEGKSTMTQENKTTPVVAPAAESTAKEPVTVISQADVDAAVERGRTEGATAERDRIHAVEAAALPGHDALVAEMKKDGKTTGPQAAERIVAAERIKRSKVKDDLIKDAPTPVAHSEAPVTATTKAEPDPKEVADKAKHYQAEQAKQGRILHIADCVAHIRKEMGLK
jgi:signal peptide peptidase SppA